MKGILADLPWFLRYFLFHVILLIFFIAYFLDDD